MLQSRLVAADGIGSMLVESDPAGASVYVDGRLAGETPLTLPAIAAGVHRVRVVRLGYLENSRLVTVEPGARATLRARLTDPAPQTARAAALKIVVLEGEGAVNIIQQKTAVAPVIEVRDRNDQPVSGASRPLCDPERPRVVQRRADVDARRPMRSDARPRRD